MITKICGVENNKFINASYSKASWQKHSSAFLCYKTFTKYDACNMNWPLDTAKIIQFCKWMLDIKGLNPATVESYVHTLKLMHEIQNLDCQAFNSSAVKLTIKGASNLQLYVEQKSVQRNVVTLPMLRIIGHRIAGQVWDQQSKQIIWVACCLAFFGSLRMGEILFENERGFDPGASFLWEDVLEREGSLLCRIKSPKSKNKGGDYVDIFEFPGKNCCPVKAFKKWKVLVGPKKPNDPVFSFGNGKLLTKTNFNRTISGLLKDFEAKGAKISGHSFRAGVPATLAKFPEIVNNDHIMGWRRWSSKAYLSYTRLKIDQKRKIFEKIVKCLENKW